MGTFLAEQVTTFKKAFNEYLEKYGNLYSETALEYIKSHFLGTEFENGIAIDIMSQIYEETGVYEAVGKTLYSNYPNYLQEHYDIDRNILDVGCGFYPAFAKKVAKSQKSGSVKAIDYEVITTDVPGITVERKRFDENYDVSNIDFIYGLEPCEAVIDMIKSANKNNLDLCICMCGCSHFNTPFGYGNYNPYLHWLRYVTSVMENTLPDNRDYEMEYTDFIQYPIFRTYKKKTLIQIPKIEIPKIII